MAGQQILCLQGSVKVHDRSCRASGNRFILGVEAPWRTVRACITSIRRGIESAGIASDRKRLMLLIAQRHRLWD